MDDYCHEPDCDNSYSFYPVNWHWLVETVSHYHFAQRWGGKPHCGIADREMECGHSAVIVTKNNDEAELFMESVDSAAVYQNASTRFTDGGQFGLGGELAISTDKLHHRGPMGLHHLVTNKWYVFGDGQIR